MLLALEIAFLLGGLYAIFTGKLPGGFLFGGGKYTAEGPAARWLGALLLLPLPLAFAVGFILALLLGEGATPYIWIAELLIIISIAIIASILFRRIRRPVP